jgi:hypothetical protein
VVGGGIAAAAVSTYVGSSIVAGEAEVDNKHDRFTVKVSASVAVVVLPETLPLPSPVHCSAIHSVSRMMLVVTADTLPFARRGRQGWRGSCWRGKWWKQSTGTGCAR